MTDLPSPDSIVKYFDEDQLAKRIDEMASQIAADMPEDFVIVSLLNGAFMFTADLVRALHAKGARPAVEFIRLSSYGDKTESSGRVKMQGDMPATLEGKQVLIVDDILDSGRTIAFARHLVKGSGAAEVKVCVLLDKPARRSEDQSFDYAGFQIEDTFVIGYGLDIAGYYRELPYVGRVITDKKSPTR